MQCNCGDTLNSSYVMSYDLIDCAGYGLIIGSNDITLDCNGHTVDGSGTDWGIYLDHWNRATIKNCNVRQFRTGIYVWGSSNNILLGNTADNNYHRGIDLVYSSDNNILTNNTANNNKDKGIVLYSSSNNNLTGNTANNNSGSGISLGNFNYYGSDNNVLTGNTANNNKGNGIYLVYSSNSILSNNTANNNIYDGIYCNYFNWVGCDNSILSGNTANNNGRYGIALDDYSPKNNLTNNTANNNSKYGIYLSGSNNILTNNTANYNKWGVRLSGSNNTLANNAANNNSNYGVFLWGGDNNFLTGNTVSNNAWEGIKISKSSNNEVTNNIMNENHQLDLSIVALDVTHCQHRIINNTGSGNKPIIYSNGSINIADKHISELILCNADHSNIENVTITGSDIHQNNAVLVYLTNYSNITNLDSSNNRYGIYLSSSSNNTLTNNTADNNNQHGIYLTSSSGNSLIKSTAKNNYKNGIDLYSSSNNVLSGNTAKNNSLDGIYLYTSSNNVLTSNTANNNNWEGIGLVYGCSNNLLIDNIANSNGLNGLFLSFSSYNNLTGNTVKNNLEGGIELRGSYTQDCPPEVYYTHHNHLAWNKVINNSGNGIQFAGAVFNILTDNTVGYNEGDGIQLLRIVCDGFPYFSTLNNVTNNLVYDNIIGMTVFDSSDNLIYNNAFDNILNAIDNGNNVWNINKKLGTNIVGGPYLGGNYWSDYTGADTDGDGLGNTNLPYNSSGNIVNGGDFLPLVTSIYSVEIPLKQGWNLVSSPLNFTNITEIFEPIQPYFVSMFTYNPEYQKFIEINPLNPTHEIDLRYGVWVKVSENVTTSIVGKEFENKDIPLVQGWNLVAYPYLEEKDVSELFNNDIVYSYDQIWSTYIPNRTFNSLQTLKPGFGYWVKTS